MRAVPSEAPRFWAVPWRPPASFVLSRGADDMITLPSWDIISPAPTPNSASESLKPVSFEVHVDRADEHERSDDHRAESDLHHQPGRQPGSELGADERRDEHRRRHRQQLLTGLERVEAEHDLEVDRAARRRCPSARAAATSASSGRRGATRCAAARVRATCPARAAPAVPPTAEEPEEQDAADDQERHQREAERSDLGAADRGRVERLQPAPLTALQDAEHDQAKTRRPKGPHRRNRAVAGGQVAAPAASACARAGSR